jgi:hypothetical protein
MIRHSVISVRTKDGLQAQTDKFNVSLRYQIFWNRVHSAS